MRMVVLLLVVWSSFVAAAGAEVSIDLPALGGDYGLGGDPPAAAPASHTTTFTFPAEIANLTGLRLAVSGEWAGGLFVACRIVGGQTVCDTLPAYPDLTLALTADTAGDCSFEATVPTFGGVDATVPLIAVCGQGQADVDVLLGATVTAELSCHLPPATIANLIEATHGTLADVRIETVGVVPAAPSAWGSVKALYR